MSVSVSAWHKQQQQDRENRVPIPTLVDCMGTLKARTRQALGEAGPLARALPGYVVRAQQVRFADHVVQALEEKRPALLEAGTGTGKSMGYLVPAILGGGRVVVATATKALQGQLADKDLPLLARAGLNFTWSVLKGKKNYLCLHKSTQPLLEFQEEQDQVHAWEFETQTGDLEELALDLTAQHLWPLREALTADEEDCAGRRCPCFEECWYYRARERAAEAQVIVVNHHLYALDLALGGQLLPAHEAVVMDEAHGFAEVVRATLEGVVSGVRVRRLVTKAGKVGVSGAELERFAGPFFDALEAHVARVMPRGADAVGLEIRDFPWELRRALLGLRLALKELRVQLAARAVADDQGGDGVRAGKAEKVFLTAQGFLEDLQRLARPGSAVVWAERPEGKTSRLRITPVDVSDWLRERLFEAEPRKAVVLCSATLATGGADPFGFVRGELGLRRPLELQVPAPFDYRRQMLYYLPAVPAEASEWRRGETSADYYARYAATVAPHLEQVLEAARGQALVLFSTWGVLRQAAERLRYRLDLPIRCQGEMSKAALLHWLRTTPHAVLLATGSFWEGVDIPGDALRCVVIDRIPFPPHNHPVEQARRDALGSRRYFTDYQLPRAVQALRQGVGRLIRTHTDRGLMVLLDPRFRSKGYGPGILAALPGSPSPGSGTLNPASLPHVGKFLAAGGAR